ncbi:hypothetical protein Syun_019914 [Stephania yunnanensis]|uniref:Alcohol dehydrogenase n=1 Tax=Stephania yunnanensis TaxID=152371 RepID=A0AAP0IWY4_9MAGN
MSNINYSHHQESSSDHETRGKTITCKAAVVWGPGEPFSVEEIQVDPPKQMEVRIKILYTSICHTDLSAWKGENESQRVYPRILGHEAVGVIESVGEGVEDMREGDYVVPVFNGECGQCVYCKSDETNLCERYRVNPLKCVMLADSKTRFWTQNGPRPIFHFLNTSTFTEFTVLDSACVVKIDSDSPLKKVTLLSCGVSTGLGAAWNTANVQPGSTVAIFGLGAVGLAVAEGARSRGASRIIGVDINPDKFIKGKAMGITDFINPNDVDSVSEKIMKMIKGGVQYSFECAGKLSVLREAFLSTHDGWGLTVILGIHATPEMMPFHPMELFQGRRIIGSVFGDFKPKTQLPLLARQCLQGVVNLDGFITHELPFSQINEAFQLLVDGKSLRCLLQL